MKRGNMGGDEEMQETFRAVAVGIVADLHKITHTYDCYECGLPVAERVGPPGADEKMIRAVLARLEAAGLTQAHAALQRIYEWDMMSPDCWTMSNGSDFPSMRRVVRVGLGLEPRNTEAGSVF